MSTRNKLSLLYSEVRKRSSQKRSRFSYVSRQILLMVTKGRNSTVKYVSYFCRADKSSLMFPLSKTRNSIVFFAVSIKMVN